MEDAKCIRSSQVGPMHHQVVHAFDFIMTHPQRKQKRLVKNVSILIWQAQSHFD